MCEVLVARTHDAHCVHVIGSVIGTDHRPLAIIGKSPYMVHHVTSKTLSTRHVTLGQGSLPPQAQLTYQDNDKRPGYSVPLLYSRKDGCTSVSELVCLSMLEVYYSAKCNS